VNIHYKDFIGHEEFIWKLKEDMDDVGTQVLQIETELHDNQVTLNEKTGNPSRII
jgi:hypothetical protein